MEVKIKKIHPDAVIPYYSKDGDAGLDLTCVDFNAGDKYTEYNTGLCVEIPKGYVGLVFPRSSISGKAQYLGNAVGVIDSGYRGEIKVRMKLDFPLLEASLTGSRQFGEDPLYDIGDRIAQLIIIPYPQINFKEVEELSNTDRSSKGFGSTGV